MSKIKKVKDLNLVCHGQPLELKQDSKMSNFWLTTYMDKIPVEIGKAKTIHAWLTAYLKKHGELK